MGSPNTRKRLRIRLKAADAPSLAATFGSNLGEDTVYVPGLRKVEVGTAVRLELLYASGEPALCGDGSIERIDKKGSNVEIEWDDEAWPLLLDVLASVQGADLDKAASADQVESAFEEAMKNKPVTEEVDISQVVDESEVLEEASVVDELADLEDEPLDLGGGLVVPILDDDVGSPSMDLIADLEVPPPSESSPPVAKSTEYAFSSDDEPPAPDDEERPKLTDDLNTDREPGEVTPLGRIELVRQTVEPLRTGEIEPLMAAEEQHHAIPKKRAPLELPAPSKRVIGIDVGAAHLRVAAQESEQPELVASRRGGSSIPAAVVIYENGKTLVGEAALERMRRHPGVHGTKRLLGRPSTAPLAAELAPRLPYDLAAGDEGEVAAKLGPHVVCLEEITALLIKEARRSAELAFDGESNRAVLTCPSGYGIRQRDALRLAGGLAGFHVERVVSTPLAVAVEHTGGDAEQSAELVVIDFGASHLDIATVEVDFGVYRLVRGRCRADVAGVEIDRAVAERLMLEVERGVGAPLEARDPTRIAVLMAAEHAKRTLSKEDTAHVSIEHPLEGQDSSLGIEVDLERERYDGLATPTIDEVVRICRGLEGEVGENAQVLGVGGMFGDPAVEARVREVFGDRFVVRDSERTAAFGAARIGKALGDGAPFVLAERVARPFGVLLPDGRPEPLFARGVSCPAHAKHAHPVMSDDHLEVVLYEGADKPAPYLRASIAVVPDGLEPPYDAEFELTVEDDAQLSVSAEVRGTGAPLGVELAPAVGGVKIAPAADIAEPQPRGPSGLFGWLKRKLGGS